MWPRRLDEYQRPARHEVTGNRSDDLLPSMVLGIAASHVPISFTAGRQAIAGKSEHNGPTSNQQALYLAGVLLAGLVGACEDASPIGR
jgi:hypothetical protein